MKENEIKSLHNHISELLKKNYTKKILIILLLISTVIILAVLSLATSSPAHSYAIIQSCKKQTRQLVPDSNLYKFDMLLSFSQRKPIWLLFSDLSHQ